mgnify:CR=1 FL=1
MKAGNRPPFPFPGAWLYTGDHPAVHLVGVAREMREVELRVRDHGGAIAFDTEVGRGSTFRVRLPVGRPAPTEAAR